MSDHPLSRPIQVCAAVVLILAVFAAVVLALGPGRVPEQMLNRGVPVALIVAAGIGVCGIMLALLGLIDRGGDDSHSRKVLTEIRDQLSRLNATGTASAPVAGQGSAIASSDAGRIVQLLDEIRDISLLDESQKRTRLQRLLTERRQSAAATVEAMIQQQRWSEARAALHQAQNLLGEGPELQAINGRLMEALASAEAKAFAQMQKQVAEHKANENWDDAIAESANFTTQFPDSAPGHQFQADLLAARDQWVEVTAQKVYDEVKAAIEQRAWRKALAAAQRLLAKCPNHHRARQVEPQMAIIRENADIEQRNSMEARIHELVKSNRMKEAIAVAEDLIRAYPTSPQAEIASQLILKLRDKMEEEQTQTT